MSLYESSVNKPVITFLIFLLPFFNLAKAQKINEDSLSQIVRETKYDTAKIDALLILANYRLKHKMQDSIGKSNLQQAKNLSEKINYQPGIIQCLLTTGNYFRSKNEWAKSMEAYNEIIRISSDIKDDSLRQKSQMMAFNNLGGIYNFNGDFQNSLGYRLKALEIVEQLMPENFNNRAIVYLNIASDYRQLKIPLKGIEYLNATAPFFSKLNSRLKMEFYNEYYENYITSDSNQNAKAMLGKIKEGLAKFDLSEFQKKDYALMLSNLTGLYELNVEKNASAALQNFSASLGMANDLASNTDITESLYNIGSAYLASKNYGAAINYLQIAYDSSNNNSLKNQSRKISLLLAECYKAAGENAKANSFLEKAIAFQNEIYDEEKSKELNFLEAKYQHEKSEKEIAGLKLSNAEHLLNVVKRNRMLLFGGISAAALLIILSLLYRGSRQKIVIAEKEKTLKEEQIKFLERQQQVVSLQSMVNGQETERTRIAKDLHDGLGGLFSTIKMQLSTLKHEEKSLETNELFQKSYELVDNASVEVRRIAHNMMPEVLIKLGLIQAIQELCNSINAGKLMRVSMQSYGMDQRLNASTEMMLFRIVQELLNNIIKHAYASEAIIQFNREEDRLSVTVEDNGRGFNLEDSSGKKAGLESVKSRVNYLNGKLSIDSEKEIGTTILMDFLINQG